MGKHVVNELHGYHAFIDEGGIDVIFRSDFNLINQTLRVRLQLQLQKPVGFADHTLKVRAAECHHFSLSPYLLDEF